MKLVVSDDHAGLRAARRAVFPALPWQRCQFHLSQNAQRFARRLEERGEIGQAMRDSPTLEDAEAMLKRKIQAFAETNQALAQWMEENVREGLTVYAFPRSLHQKIRTVLVQTARGIGDNGIWRIAKLNGILYLLDVGSKTTSFSSAFAGISASN